MVEINNQRKAFLDMLAWSEGTDNGRQKTRNHGYDVIVGGELFTDYSDHPRKLVTLNPKLKSTGCRTLPAPVDWWDAYRVSSLAWKTSLRKVRTLWHCSRLRSVALYLWLIVVISVRQSTVAAISGSLPGAGYGRSSIRLTAWLQNSKEAGGTVREIDVWAESPRLSPLWLSASSSACHGLAIIITVMIAITHKAWRDKHQRTEADERGTTDMQMKPPAWCCCVFDAKYTKELADAKAENDALRDDVAAGRRRLHQKQSVSQCEATTPPAWIMQPPPDWQTPLNGIISPSERGWSLCKTTGRNPEVY